jgi:hypothetical protein
MRLNLSMRERGEIMGDLSVPDPHARRPLLTRSGHGLYTHKEIEEPGEKEACRGNVSQLVCS